jgi:DNA-binding response OmpR family regulator
LAARCEPVGARLIAVSGYGQEQDRTRSADAGFAAHIVKPIDIEELEGVIRAEST